MASQETAAIRPPREGFRAGRRRWGCLLGLLLGLCLSSYVSGDGLVSRDPNKVKAAFLRNFAHYVTWPEPAFPDAEAAWSIGVLGDDPFGDVLEKTFEGRTEQGRPFDIYRADSLEKLPRCQILFIGYKSVERRRATLAELVDRPVLTVGDAPEFLKEGGIIQFRVGKHVEMSINLDQARAASLKVQTPMLEVSREVLEGGSIQKLR